jgi:hypothetical protein
MVLSIGVLHHFESKIPYECLLSERFGSVGPESFVFDLLNDHIVSASWVRVVSSIVHAVEFFVHSCPEFITRMLEFSPDAAVSMSWRRWSKRMWFILRSSMMLPFTMVVSMILLFMMVSVMLSVTVEEPFHILLNLIELLSNKAFLSSLVVLEEVGHLPGTDVSE